MKTLPVGFLVAISLTRPASSQGKPDGPPLSCSRFVDSAGHCLTYEPSIIQLIARPELYDGKPVRVMGYVHLEFEGNGIYVHKEDRDHLLFHNGLWVEFKIGFMPSAQCQDRYVVLEGVFRASDRGHMGMWSGAIVDITRCDPWR